MSCFAAAIALPFLYPRERHAPLTIAFINVQMTIDARDDLKLLFIGCSSPVALVVQTPN